MRVIWSAAGRGNFIPEGDSVEAEDSIIEMCYKSGRPCTGEERLSLGSIRGNFKLECTKAPGTNDEPYVLSLIHLQNPIVPPSRQSRFAS